MLWTEDDNDDEGDGGSHCCAIRTIVTSEIITNLHSTAGKLYNIHDLGSP